MNKNLMPCPFCGHEAKTRKGVQGITFFYCDSCGAVVSFRGAKSLEVTKPSEAWNRRHNQTE